MFHGSGRRSVLFYFISVSAPLIAAVALGANIILTQHSAQIIQHQRDMIEEAVSQAHKGSLEQLIAELDVPGMEQIGAVILDMPEIRWVRIQRGAQEMVSFGQPVEPHQISTIALAGVSDNGSEPWALSIGVQDPTLWYLLSRQLPEHATFVVVLILISATAFHTAFSAQVLRPVDALRRAVRKGAEDGGMIPEVPLDGAQEIADLVLSHNLMVRRIRDEEELRDELNTQLNRHLNAYRRLSAYLAYAAEDDSRLVSLLFDMIRAEPGVLDAGVVLCKGESTPDMACLGGRSTAGWDRAGAEVLQILRDVAAKEPVMQQDGHWIFVQPIEHKRSAIGYMLIETMHAQPAVRESTRLYLISLAKLCERIFERDLRRSAEVALQNARTELFEAIEALNGVLLFESDGRLLASNARAKSLLETLPGEERVRDIGSFVAAVEDLANGPVRFRNWFNAAGSGEDFDVECKDGTWLSFTRARIAQGQTICSVRDTTATKQMQRSVENDLRMKEVGRVGSGITHDFNNYLQAMAGNIELARTLLPDGSEVAALLDATLEQTELAKGTTRQILSFLRNAEAAPEPVSPHAAVQALCVALKSRDSSRYTLDVSYDTPFWLHADPVMLGRALKNLATNSIYQAQALGRAAHLRLSFTQSRRHARCYVHVTLSDDCGGFPKTVLDQATEPFFTTKPQGAGTGLGLTMVKDFTIASGGSLLLSNVAGGAAVTMMLPATEPLEEIPRLRPQPLSLVPPVARNIVLIEDSDHNRQLIRRMLESGGHQVMDFRDVEDLRQGLDTLPDPVDVVVSDFNLPDGNGRMALGLLDAHLGRCLPCLYITGDGAQPELQRLDSREVLLLKPFALKELHRALEALPPPERLSVVTPPSEAAPSQAPVLLSAHGEA